MKRSLLLTLALLFGAPSAFADSHCEKNCHNEKCTCESSCEKKEGGECTCENCECECCKADKTDSGSEE
jgi:hypothetical protein